MYFDIDDDVVYLYIENLNKSVYKLERNYDWDIELIDGDMLDLGSLFSNMDIDDIVKSLSKKYKLVEIIDVNSIDEYMY